LRPPEHEQRPITLDSGDTLLCHVYAGSVCRGIKTSTHCLKRRRSCHSRCRYRRQSLRRARGPSSAFRSTSSFDILSLNLFFMTDISAEPYEPVAASEKVFANAHTSGRCSVTSCICSSALTDRLSSALPNIYGRDRTAYCFGEADILYRWILLRPSSTAQSFLSAMGQAEKAAVAWTLSRSPAIPAPISA